MKDLVYNVSAFSFAQGVIGIQGGKI